MHRKQNPSISDNAMSVKQKRNWKKRVGLIIQVLGLILLFAFSVPGIWYENGVIHASPLHPAPDKGLVVPFNSHGILHYISPFNSILFQVIFASFFVGVPLLILGRMISRSAGGMREE